MRNFLTGAIAGIALGTAFVGSASAAHMPNDPQSTGGNLAMQDELQRDDSQNWLHRAPLGELVTPSSSLPSTADSTANAGLSLHPALTGSPTDRQVWLRTICSKGQASIRGSVSHFTLEFGAR